ncbi:MAG: SRPBCC family protein [Flavobacteriales bacterium]|nr:SRPBCC family protein [Flavobacteriales bacterium]
MRSGKFKVLMLIGLALTTFNSAAMAQKERKYREIKMDKTSEAIHVSADSLWSIIRQFDDVAIWSSSMDKITLHGEPEFEGATCNSRTCESAQGFGEVDEKMTLFSNASRELAYESTGGGPDFLLFGKNHWTIIEIGPNQSALNLDFEMHLKRFSGFFLGGIIKKSITKEMPQFFNDLKVYAETGQVSEAKKERTEKLEKKKKYKVIEKILTSDTINVSSDSLWAILREFDKVADWTSTLNHSKGTGEAKFEGTTCNERICESANHKLIEELTMFNDNKMELAYELTEGAPGFVKLASNHWTVHEIGPNQSQVQMDIKINLSKFMGFFLAGAMTKEMTKQILIVLSDLKIFAETGEVSELKKAQIEKMRKKNKRKN